MSRATELARLPRHRVIEVWQRTFPHNGDGRTVRAAAATATKEQLVAAIVEEEERRLRGTRP